MTAKAYYNEIDPGAARVVRLRAYGNAINAEAAQAFIERYQETRNHH